jgi:hypothetical protein
MFKIIISGRYIKTPQGVLKEAKLQPNDATITLSVERFIYMHS